MAFLNLSGLQFTKMAFTDLTPDLAGATGLTSALGSAVKNYFKLPKVSLSSNPFKNFESKFNSVDSLIGKIRNPVVQLFLNPDTIQVNKKVLFDKKQTRGGFVVQFWGHDLEDIEVTAATAYFEISKNPIAAFELLKSQCYQNRFDPNQPFVGTPIIGMLFETQILRGYFTHFDYKLESAQPYQFKYSFGFTVTENVASFLTGSNLASLISGVENVGKRFHLFNSANQNQSATSIVPDAYQWGKGWGVQLF